MLGRKMYKTKLCLLYQRGRCPRQNCSFAHGDVELRRFGGSFNALQIKSIALFPSIRGCAHLKDGKRDYRSSDLRDRLDRRPSPTRRYSPGRDGRSYHAFRSRKPFSHDRGSSLSRSPIRRSERRPKKKLSIDGESDISGSHKLSDTDDARKENAVSTFDGKALYEEQLREAKSDIEKLDDHKAHLEIFLEKKFDEAHILSSKIEDLEMQLNREQEDCKRTNLKIEKFFKAYVRYIKAQEELKRSEAHFQKFGDQLGVDISKVGVNEEDSSINILSDGEPNGDIRESIPNEILNSGPPLKKRAPFNTASTDELKFGNVSKKSRHSGALSKPDKIARSDGPSFSAEDATKDPETVIFNPEKKGLPLSLVDIFKRKRGKISSNFGSLAKNRSSDGERILPSTSMAANDFEELIEDIEIDEKSDGMIAAASNENASADKKSASSYMPPIPPPVKQNAYKQYEDDDEDVDVEKVDSEMVDIDLNGDVDIEQ